MDLPHRICTPCSWSDGPDQLATHVHYQPDGLANFACPVHASRYAAEGHEIVPMEVWYDAIDQSCLIEDILHQSWAALEAIRRLKHARLE